MERLINAFSTRLSADITSGATSCTVTVGVPLSAVGQSARMVFYDVPGGNSELLLATFTTATSWTLQRAVRIDFQLPEGTPGAFISPGGAEHLTHEREFLIARGGQFKVLEREPFGQGDTRLVVECVGHAPLR